MGLEVKRQRGFQTLNLLLLHVADLHRPMGLKVRGFLGAGQPEANIQRVTAFGV